MILWRQMIEVSPLDTVETDDRCHPLILWRQMIGVSPLDTVETDDSGVTP